jgi:hypothetical protein
MTVRKVLGIVWDSRPSRMLINYTINISCANAIDPSSTMAITLTLQCQIIDVSHVANVEVIIAQDTQPPKISTLKETLKSMLFAGLTILQSKCFGNDKPACSPHYRPALNGTVPIATASVNV